MRIGGREILAGTCVGTGWEGRRRNCKDRPCKPGISNQLGVGNGNRTLFSFNGTPNTPEKLYTAVPIVAGFQFDRCHQYHLRNTREMLNHILRLDSPQVGKSRNDECSIWAILRYHRMVFGTCTISTLAMIIGWQQHASCGRLGQNLNNSR